MKNSENTPIKWVRFKKLTYGVFKYHLTIPAESSTTFVNTSAQLRFAIQVRSVDDFEQENQSP